MEKEPFILIPSIKKKSNELTKKEKSIINEIGGYEYEIHG
jgi:hypothetical protein